MHTFAERASVRLFQLLQILVRITAATIARNNMIHDITMPMTVTVVVSTPAADKAIGMFKNKIYDKMDEYLI